jgi:hypothetical protein
VAVSDDDRQARRLEAIADLLEHAQMPAVEVERRVALARDVDYWRGLTQLTIESESGLRQLPIASTDIRGAVDQFSADGYFELPPIVGASDLQILNSAIDAINNEGWPPVFLWVFDAPWRIARLPAIAELLESRLGAGYAQIPHIWTHIVPGVVGAAGWPPHFDGLGRDAGRASVWVALTEARIDNGCMYLIPRRLLPFGFDDQWLERDVPMRDVLRTLQAARALPVKPGAALGWDFSVFHWGGRCLKAGEPRRALSLEFLSAEEKTTKSEGTALSPAGPLLSFSERLGLIGRAITSYEKFERGLVRYRALAQRLRE